MAARLIHKMTCNKPQCEACYDALRGKWSEQQLVLIRHDFCACVCACVCAWQMAGVSPLVLCHVGKISRYDTTSSWVTHAAPDPSLLSDSRSDSCVPLTVLPTGCVQVSPRYVQKCFSTFLSFLSIWIGMEIKTQRFQCGVQHLLLINWQLCTQPAFFLAQNEPSGGDYAC